MIRRPGGRHDSGGNELPDIIRLSPSNRLDAPCISAPSSWLLFLVPKHHGFTQALN